MFPSNVRILASIGLMLAMVTMPCLADSATDLVGHWPLAADAKDVSGHGNDGVAHQVRFDGQSAIFNGRDAFIEVPPKVKFDARRPTFSLSAWVHVDERLKDALGDVVCQFDPARRVGFQLGVMNYAGVTTHQSNYRNLYFGVDDGGKPEKWVDHGRPGNSLYIMALTVWEGALYAGTFETGAEESGHVYRFAGGEHWEDCGSPDPCNAVSALAVFEGKLYAGVAKYRSGGSALPDSPNPHLGGKVYRYEGNKQWTCCGKLGEADAVMGLAVYDGQLFAIPLYHQGTYRYEGGENWADCGTSGVRLMALGVYNGHLYGAGNEGKGKGGVYRYDGGRTWSHAGEQEGVTQVYSFATYEGSLFAGTWPNAAVFQFDGERTWKDVGRLGMELEVMGMAVYNGKLYGGTLPLAEVYRYDGPGRWTNTGQLDCTEGVKYRRAWSMAVFQGRLFCGTLPSGHVFSLRAGNVVTEDRELSSGWHHLAAVRRADQLVLYVDGKQVAASPMSGGVAFAKDQPLRIGFGSHDYWNGRIKEVRLYSRPLSEEEIDQLSVP
ncbi:MAG: LamG domain-containing protein [Planctomycetota bacterium]